MRHLILTSAQAARVRGLSVKHHALDPVELTDGTFALPVSVLTAEPHAKHRTRLASLPQRDLSMADFKWYAEQPR